VHRKEEREHLEFLVFSGRAVVDNLSVVARVIVGT
jgi:hypothetical protein